MKYKKFLSLNLDYYNKYKKQKTIYLSLFKAFSLIEMMVVIIIIGIVAAIIIPRYRNYIQKAKVIQMIILVEPCKEDIYKTYVNSNNNAFPVSITCQGANLPNDINTFNVIPSNNTASRIRVAYSFTPFTSPASPGSANLSLQHTDLTSDNGTICSLTISLQADANGDLNNICTVNSECKYMINQGIFPSNCT